jgi:hypothetical protein
MQPIGDDWQQRRLTERLDPGSTMKAAIEALAHVRQEWRTDSVMDHLRFPRRTPLNAAQIHWLGVPAVLRYQAIAPLVLAVEDITPIRYTLEYPHISSTDVHDFSCNVSINSARDRKDRCRYARPTHPVSWRQEALMTESRPIFPSGSLNAALYAFQAACAREWPPDAFALVNQTLADLAETGIQEAALQAGDVAPSVTLPDQEGRPVHSRDLLATGPLVLVFSGGRW